MRTSGLGKMNACFYIAGAESNVLADRTGPAFLEGLQDFPSNRIGDGVQDSIYLFFRCAHGKIGIDCELTPVNMKRRGSDAI